MKNLNFEILACPDCKTGLKKNSAEELKCSKCGRIFELDNQRSNFISLMPNIISEEKETIMKWWGENMCDLDAYIKGSENIERGTWAYFRNTDRKWFKWHHPWACTKFPIMHKWLDFDELKGKKVLEIGCGVGTMFEQFAGMGVEIHGLDINLPSCEMTWKRTDLFKLSGCVYQGDAENLSFKDGTFDFVFTYGVLHHTSDIQQAFDEMYRVLKPGGQFFMMLYNKDSINFWWHIIFLHGILRGKLFKMTTKELTAARADRSYQGGAPRSDFLSKGELRKRLCKFSKIEIHPTGPVSQVRLLPWSKLPILKIIPNFIARWIVDKIGMLNYIKGVKQYESGSYDQS